MSDRPTVYFAQGCNSGCSNFVGACVHSGVSHYFALDTSFLASECFDQAFQIRIVVLNGTRGMAFWF